MLTAKQAGALLGVSANTMYALARAGLIAHHRPGVGRGTLRFEEADVLAYKESCRVPGCNADYQPASAAPRAIGDRVRIDQSEPHGESVLMSLEDVAELWKITRERARRYLVKLPEFPDEAPGSTRKNRRWRRADVMACLAGGTRPSVDTLPSVPPASYSRSKRRGSNRD